MNTLSLQFSLLCSTALILFPLYSLGASIDLRNLSEVPIEYEIGFCARPSPDTIKHLPGHVFVSFSVRQPDGNHTFTSIGHTVQGGVSPISAVWSYFGDPVYGYLAEEKYTSAMQSCLVAKVNKADYESAFVLTRNPLARMGIGSNNDTVLQAYKLGEQDCMNFMIGIANTLRSKGFRVPDRRNGEFPLPYMQRLIDANTPIPMSAPVLKAPTRLVVQ